MTDPRLLPSNGRVAHVSLEGTVSADRYVQGRMMMVQQPMSNITKAPRGPRVSQLVFGERFLALETTDGFVFGQCEKDGQVGYMNSGALTGAEAATHWVMAPATHLYPKPDMRSAPEVSLFFGSRLRVLAERDGFYRIHTGHFVPSQHILPIKARFSDPVGVADLFLGTPYLWGGTSRWGIDCSSLIQTALHACGVACPRDSDQQETALGHPLEGDGDLERGDLIFWPGHVGILSNADTILHANAHHMMVAYEPLAEAIDRILRVEDSDITAVKRLPNLA